MKVTYKFDGTTCAKYFKTEEEMNEFFDKYKMLEIIKIEKLLDAEHYCKQYKKCVFCPRYQICEKKGK